MICVAAVLVVALLTIPWPRASSCGTAHSPPGQSGPRPPPSASQSPGPPQPDDHDPALL